MAWYDEKDLEYEAEQNEIWTATPDCTKIEKEYEKMRNKFMFFKEIERNVEKQYSIFEVNKKYGIKLRVNHLYSELFSDKVLVKPFELELYKYQKMDLENYSKMNEEEQNEFCDSAYNRYNEMLKKADKYFVLLQIFMYYLKSKGDIINIGIGVNRRTGNPNFQLYLDTNSLKIKDTNFGIDFPKKPEEVNLFGNLYRAKNFKEVQYEQPIEFELISKNSYCNHDFEYKQWFNNELYKHLGKLFTEIRDYYYMI